MSKLLFDDNPIVVDVKLARKIGLNEAIIVQQIHYWIEINKKKGSNFYEGCYWTYNSIKEWADHFPFFGERTIQRLFNSLKKLGILKSDNFNKAKFDKTLWYTIDYAKLDEIVRSLDNQEDCRDCQIGTIEERKSVNETDKLAERECQNGVMDTDKLAKRERQNGVMEDAKLAKPIPEITTETTTEINTETNSKKKTPAQERKEILFLLQNYAGDDNDLLNTLVAFAEMRQKMKNGSLTIRAAELIVKDLDKFAQRDNDKKIEILNRSIMSNWKGIFDLPQGHKFERRPLYEGNDYIVEQQEENAFDRLRKRREGI